MWHPATAGVGGALLTSVFIAVAVALVAVIVSTPAARALALHEFRGKRLVLFVLLLPVLAPPLAAAMGVHAAFLRLGLADTYTGVALFTSSRGALRHPDADRQFRQLRRPARSAGAHPWRLAVGGLDAGDAADDGARSGDGRVVRAS